MKKILLNVNAIECCVEKKDACVIKTKTGSLWVCPLNYNFNDYQINTYDFIKNAKHNELLELPLKEKVEG